MSAWQRVFMQSKVNQGVYDENGLPPQYWEWPQQTWFQKRLLFLRETTEKDRAQRQRQRL